MVQVIDALIVELGLDPKKFTAGQREAMDAFKRTQDSARKGAKEIESDGRRLSDAFSGIKRQALGLTALFLGGMGVKQFVAFITQADASTGRLAKTLLMTTEELSAWQHVAQQTGGDANTMASSMANLSGKVQQFLLTGQGDFLPLLNVLGIGLFDANKNLKTTGQLFLEIAKAVEKVDPARAKAIMTGLGIDPQTVNTLLRGEAALRRMLGEQKQLGTATKASADAAQQLETAWSKSIQSAQNLGRAILNWMTPALVRTLDLMMKLTQALQWQNQPESRKAADQQAERLQSDLRKKFGDPKDVPFFKWLQDWIGGSETPAAATPAPSPSGLRIKPGAGAQSVATTALARTLQSQVPGLDKFTSFNDPYHALLGRKSAHTRGQALDFTIKDTSQSAAVASQVRQKLAEMGIDAKVIDEYTNPSRGSTGGHIHVQFNNAAAAQKFVGPGGAVPAATSPGGARPMTNTNTSTTTINTMVVNTQATAGPEIAKDIRKSLETNSLASRANYGQQ